MTLSHPRVLEQIAIATALAWACGLRAYLVLFLLGLAIQLGWLDVPDSLLFLGQPLILACTGVMTAIEFGADKLPLFDSLWDMFNTVTRIPAGAMLPAYYLGAQDNLTFYAILILGGGIAAGAHLVKSGTRATANLSPEPFSNWTLSFLEDAIVPLALWLALTHVVLFFAFIAITLTCSVLLIRFIIRNLPRLFKSKAT